jgi:hypothetical protein
MMNCDVRAPEARGAGCRGASDCGIPGAEWERVQDQMTLALTQPLPRGEEAPSVPQLACSGSGRVPADVMIRRVGADRFGPHKSAGDRLVPDKNFSPHAGGACTQYCGRGNVWAKRQLRPTEQKRSSQPFDKLSAGSDDPTPEMKVTGGNMPSLPRRLPSGQRWDYAGLSGTKTGRFPLNPGYSRVIPHNEFQNFLRARNGIGLFHAKRRRKRRKRSGLSRAMVLLSDETRRYGCKHMISRWLGRKQAFFGPFLTLNNLISRRLGEFRGKISQQGASARPQSLHPKVRDSSPRLLPTQWVNPACGDC